MIDHYVQKNHYETIQLDEEWIILNTDDFTLTKLNAMGGFCWSALHQAHTLHSLVQTVQEKYESVSETVEKDIETFLADLMLCGLLKHAS
jgi:hypothetical protein